MATNKVTHRFQLDLLPTAANEGGRFPTSASECLPSLVLCDRLHLSVAGFPSLPRQTVMERSKTSQLEHYLWPEILVNSLGRIARRWNGHPRTPSFAESQEIVQHRVVGDMEDLTR